MDPVRALLMQYRGTDPSHPGPLVWQGQEGREDDGCHETGRSTMSSAETPHRKNLATTWAENTPPDATCRITLPH